MFRIAICDNDKEELGQTKFTVETFIKKHAEIKAKIETFLSSEEFQNYLKQNSDLLKTGDLFDAYILDVMMPCVDGIELAHTIREFDQKTPILFTTSFKKYAFDAFGVQALDYLLKPVNVIQMDNALQRCYVRAEKKKTDEIIVKAKNGIKNIRIRDIVYVENSARCAVYHLRNQCVVTSVCNRGKFEDSIAPLPERKQFLRPHKSYLVNMEYIKEFGVDKLELENDVMIPISRNQRNDVKHKFLSYYTENEDESSLLE